MKTKHIIELLKLLAKKENQSLDHYGFQKMSEAIGQPYPGEVISGRYLYDLYRKSLKRWEAGILVSSPRTILIDTLAKHLDYPTFSHYESAQEKPISTILASCAGNWWSYVRANAGELLLKAPVKIHLDTLNNTVFMTLRSKGRIFNGELAEDGGSLTSTLDSGSGKKLALVFKLGNSTDIELLQGVFCGISSAGDPISGREILHREDAIPYEEMQWKQLSLNDSSVDLRIRNYFSVYNANCIKIKNVSSFTLSDLEA